jgi:uncharacterized protein YndB with AHSA1/START domain
VRLLEALRSQHPDQAAGALVRFFESCISRIPIPTQGRNGDRARERMLRLGQPGLQEDAKEETIMKKTQFIYVTYISTTAEKLWEALLNSRTTRKYWQHENVSDWLPGSKWEHRAFDKDRTLRLVGKVIESSKPRRLVLTWAFPEDEAREEKHTRVTFELEPIGSVTRLAVTHDQLEPGSSMLEGISDGWPKVLSSLKSLMETGRPLPKLW